MALKTQAAHRKDLTSGAGAKLEHRHFAFIAAVLAQCVRLMPDERDHVANQFANACASTNPNFDRARFLRACGVQS